jgi:putative Mg2+ transporter-C (MgtC) family protein
MAHVDLDIVIRLLAAATAGALIGIERTYHGRPAGFRTHTLVCTASSLLMLLALYQWQVIGSSTLEAIRVDPMRMAQGIMTGIGFLGAGAIIKEKLTIRGLTTAASIWATAAIGVAIGMGFYFAALAALLLTLGTLSILRWIESMTPTMHYARLQVRFARGEHLPHPQLREILDSHKISSADMSYQLQAPEEHFQYQMTIRTAKAENFERLAETLTTMRGVASFSIRPTGG